MNLFFTFQAGSLLNPSPQQLRWNAFQSAKLDNRDLSIWKTNNVNGGDVDMRAIPTVSSVPNTSCEV